MAVIWKKEYPELKEGECKGFPPNLLLPPPTVYWCFSCAPYASSHPVWITNQGRVIEVSPDAVSIENVAQESITNLAKIIYQASCESEEETSVVRQRLSEEISQLFPRASSFLTYGVVLKIHEIIKSSL